MRPAVHAVQPVIPLHQIRTLPLALHQPMGGKTGHDGLQLGIKKVALLSGKLLEIESIANKGGCTLIRSFVIMEDFQI